MGAVEYLHALSAQRAERRAAAGSRISKPAPTNVLNDVLAGIETVAAAAAASPSRGAAIVVTDDLVLDLHPHVGILAEVTNQVRPERPEIDGQAVESRSWAEALTDLLRSADIELGCLVTSMPITLRDQERKAAAQVALAGLPTPIRTARRRLEQVASNDELRRQRAAEGRPLIEFNTERRR